MDINFSKEVGIACAKIKKKIKDFGLADAFVLITAKILTGDPHFKGMNNVVYLQ